MNATPSAAAQLLDAQARRLQLVAARVEGARQRLPHPAEAVWRGPAALVYRLACESLAAQFDAAHRQLVSAVTASRRASAIVMAAANE
jgi:hypothetical protein